MVEPHDENHGVVVVVGAGADASVETNPEEAIYHDDVVATEVNQHCCGSNDEDDRPSMAVGNTTTTVTNSNSKPRRWLYDRMFGRSPPPKPPSVWCYVPPCISL